MKTIQTVNPYTFKTLASYTTHSSEDLERIIQAAQKQYLQWKDISISERAVFLQNCAEILRNNKNQYAKTISLEMGKPISQAEAEVEKCAWVCDYYAENGAIWLEDEIITTEAAQSYVRYDPIGVILAVMPWNFPFWQVFRFAAPTLLAGNTVLLKHASNVMGSALLIEEIWKKAGLPTHTFQTLVVGSEAVQEIIAHPDVAAVTLTGSSQAGSAVAATTGKYLKKSVLELGGNNALIVLEDADMETAVEKCITARFQNTGQSCIAGKRLLLHQKIGAPFLELLVQKTAALRSGDPLEATTYIGVMAREDLAVELEDQVQRSIQMGAQILLGGKRHKTYFEPTIVTGVTPQMPLFTEETFGPVLAVTEFNTLQEAVTLSNNSVYGLGVSFFTKNIQPLMPYISQMQEGAVFINDLVKSDPRLPFGGIKKSGYGRELGPHGIREFVNVKTIVIQS
jgi:succinate-semialdehyde dehydrogenase/glutarate-semialdehyde dehydrogenase